MSVSQELTNCLKFLSILGLCTFTVNSITTKPNQLKLLGSVALLFLFAIATPLSYHQYICALFQILYETNNITTILNNGGNIFLFVSHSLPIFLILTYISIVCIAICHRNNHMALIDYIFKLNRYQSDSSKFQYSWRKSVSVIFAFLVIMVTTTTIDRVKTFNSTLSISFTILYPAILLIYFVKIAYIQYIGIIISDQLKLIIHTNDVDLSALLEMWMVLKNLYGKTFGEIIIVNSFYDFITLSVRFYNLFFIYDSGYFAVIFSQINYNVIPCLVKTTLLTTSFEALSTKVRC